MMQQNRKVGLIVLTFFSDIAIINNNYSLAAKRDLFKDKKKRKKKPKTDSNIQNGAPTLKATPTDDKEVTMQHYYLFLGLYEGTCTCISH